MTHQRKFVKELTLKHKRENKTIQTLKNAFRTLIQKVTQPIKFGSSSLKKFNVEYEAQDESLINEFNDIPDKKEQKITPSEKHQPEAMVEKLKDAYKL